MSDYTQQGEDMEQMACWVRIYFLNILHTQKHINTHTHTHTHKHTQTHTHICTNTHTNTPTNTHKHTQTHTCTYTHTQRNTQKYTNTNTEDYNLPVRPANQPAARDDHEHSHKNKHWTYPFIHELLVCNILFSQNI